MKKQITRISPLQTAKVLALLYFVISLPMILLMGIMAMLAPGPQPPFFSGLMLAMPFLYLVFGFLFTLFGAWVYNLVVKWVGGIEITTIEPSDI
jgi:hypothetical protein